MNYDWYYAEVSDDDGFIVSDNPAYLIQLEFNDICFPISRKKAIVFQHKNEPHLITEKPINRRLHLSDRSVFVYNLFQTRFAQRYLFGDESDLRKFTNIVMNYDPQMWDTTGVMFKD